EDSRVLLRRLGRRLLELLDLLRGVGLGDGHRLRLLRRRRAPVLDRARLGGMPLLHALQAALLRRSEALALDGLVVDDDRARRAERLAVLRPHLRDVLAVYRAHVSDVALLEEEAGGEIGLHR